MELFSVLVAAYLSLECFANFNQVYAYVNKREPWKITKWSSNLFYKWHPKLGVFYYLIMIALMVGYTFGMGVIESWLLFFMAIIYGFTTLFAWIVLARKSEHKQVQVQMNAIGPQGGMTPPPIPQ